MRKPWATKFRKLMNWNKTERFDRVDGGGVLLILRESSGINSEHFAEEYLGELLRASTVIIVASLDRYCHELVCSRILKSIQSGKPNKHIRRLRIPVLAADKALRTLRRNSKARPMTHIKTAIQEMLFKETYQSSTEIDVALKMIDLSDVWNRCGDGFVPALDGTQVKAQLDRIVGHRNRIVHESDIKRVRRGGKVTYKRITEKQVEDYILFVGAFVAALDRLD